MKESGDDDMLARLEHAIDWNAPEFVETADEMLLSLHEYSDALVAAFDGYVATVGLASLTGDAFSEGLAKVARLLMHDFAAQDGLRPGDILQTKSDGLCLTFDQFGLPGDLVSLTDDSRIRGVFGGLDCLPIPTDYVLITDTYHGKDGYEPTLCAIIARSNISELHNPGSLQDTVAVPLRLGGVRIDQVIARR